MNIEKPYRLGVRAMIRDAQGRVLLLRRSRANKGFVGLWELPGGKADDGESPDQALRREVREETGLEITLGGVIGAYGVEMADKRLAIVCLHAKVAGGKLALSEEHDGHAWLDPGEIATYELVAGLKDVIQKAF